jgi:D-glycero-alpha-D-manno-heptose-7-phosphate kinase
MIISRAPVRISFLGGGTDYPEHFLQHGGAVLGTAIDKFSYVTASPFVSELFDYAIRISYRQNELVKRVDDIEHNVFRECLRLLRLDRDIELHTVADLPAFTGLGSSSAFTVSLLHALHSFKGEFVAPLELAYEAIHVERNILHDRVGCQDQALAALGGFNVIEFRREDDLVVHRIPISPERTREFQRHLFIVFSGVTRRAADMVSNQLARICDNRETLNRMRAMVDEGWEILTGGRPLSEFGELLHRAWIAKRSLDGGISNPEIDEMYRTGMAHGALGGKLLGAGGGGFLLLFAPPEAHERLRGAFADRRTFHLNINAPGSQIIFASGATR